MSYDKYDAMADEDSMAYEKLVDNALDDILDPILSRIQDMADGEHSSPEIDEVRLYLLWQESGDDGIREYLEEEHREDAEETVQEQWPSEPCCNQFSCPCGNTNNFRGL